MQPLTRRQRQILDYVAEFMASRGYSPSLAEIGEHFQLSSSATCHKHVYGLIAKGYLRRRRGCSRSIEVVAQSTGCCPTCGRALRTEGVAS